MSIGLLIVLSIFDVIGAAMVFLITYEELSRHYPDRGTPVRESTRRAAVTLVFLAALSAIVVAAVR